MGYSVIKKSIVSPQESSVAQRYDAPLSYVTAWFKPLWGHYCHVGLKLAHIIDYMRKHYAVNW